MVKHEYIHMQLISNSMNVLFLRDEKIEKPFGNCNHSITDKSKQNTEDIPQEKQAAPS